MVKILVIGAGPSLERNLRDFKLHGGDFEDATIISTDASLPKCLEYGVIPKYVATLEDYPDYMKFFDNKLVRTWCDKFEVFYSYKTAYQIKQLLNDMGINQILPILDRQADVICNVGLFAYLIAAQHLKATEIFLIGMDHCYGRGEYPALEEDTETWHRSMFTTINPYLKKRMVMNPIFKLWREEFLRERIVNRDIRCVNMTGWGVLFGRDIEWTPELI